MEWEIFCKKGRPEGRRSDGGRGGDGEKPHKGTKLLQAVLHNVQLSIPKAPQGKGPVEGG